MVYVVFILYVYWGPAKYFVHRAPQRRNTALPGGTIKNRRIVDFNDDRFIFVKRLNAVQYEQSRCFNEYQYITQPTTKLPKIVSLGLLLFL